MAETCKCAFLILAFATCFQILFIEGRSLKPTNKQEHVTNEKEPLKEMANQSTNTNLHHTTAYNQKVSLASPPVHIPTVHHSKAGRKEMTHPMAPSFSGSPGVRHPKTPGVNSVTTLKDDFKTITSGQSPGVGHNNDNSVNTFKDDFQPTTPGHSPGVGHILADEDDNEDDDPKAPGTSTSNPRSGAAFKPTTPGHSPGVGHMSSVDQSDKTDLKASKTELSVITTGHSLGDGHILGDEDEDDSEDIDLKAPGTGYSIERSSAAFKPTPPGNSPGVGHMSSVDQSDRTYSKASEIEHLSTEHSVTASGHSPGVGHILSDEDEDDSEDVDPKAPGTGSSIKRSGAAFKPTTPGHSPGIGHMSSVDQTDKTDRKATNIEHSVPRVPGGFRPAVPIQGPGVGHVFQAQTKN
ncbi:hypothetical protein NC652_018809 [Populus alba x Populus x berolinensis]|nr:hypothetical protein NC652_018809 [Populus alba x Populus x berolinensis]